MRISLFASCAVMGFLSLGATSVAIADGYASQRKEAVKELSKYFNKQFVVKGSFVETIGPEYSESVFGEKYKLEGCPAQPISPVTTSKEVSFGSGRPSTWAGALDALNIPIRSVDGARGGGYAVPVNSTARLNTPLRSTELEFEFNGIWDVRRGLVDAAAAEFERCYSQLAPGSYEVEELQRLCPYRQVARSEQGQTCVLATSGVVGAPLADGSGYEAIIRETTMCDFVGTGGSRDTNTWFTPCFMTTYKGVAQISSEIVAASALQRQVSAAKKALKSKCTPKSSRKKMRPSRVKACVMKGMAEAMAGIRS